MFDKFSYFSFNVAGVTFDSGNIPRQTLLKDIQKHNRPFNGYLDIQLHDYNFQGEVAIGVYINGYQIGNVLREHINFLLSIYNKITHISNFYITGGYYDKYYGATITIQYKKFKLF